ncbi:MAG: hypothetical protein KDC53_12385 [Saprospiraceae bacterium]|nr:hypothetical protein [Saprospiraceae bacterium]
MWLDSLIYSVRRDFGNDFFSDHFIKALDDSISKELQQKTGVDVHKENGKVFLAQLRINYNVAEYISNLHAAIGVLIEVMKVTISWNPSNLHQSTTEIDLSNDRNRIWIRDFDVGEFMAIYERQIRNNPPVKLVKPVKTFRLEIDHFHYESLYFQIRFRLCKAEAVEELMADVQVFITNWNQAGARQGYIHSSRVVTRDPEYLEYYFDFGSAGLYGIEALLHRLERYDFIDSVKVTSYRSWIYGANDQ